MKFSKPALIANLVLLVVFGGLGLAGSGAGGLGLAMILLAGLNLLLAIIAAMAKKPQAASTFSIFLALFLLVGFSICSQTKMDFH